MSLYSTYKKRCPKRMGIALGDEDLNSLFENESSFANRQPFKTNPLTKRPLSYYNELYDCLSNINNANALGNRSHSLDESTFIADAIHSNHGDEASDNGDFLTSKNRKVNSEEPKLLSEIELTVRKLISQCNELSKTKSLENQKESLRVSCKIVDKEEEDKVVYEIDFSSFDTFNEIMPDSSRTNIDFTLHPDSNEVARPLTKELLISFNGNRSSRENMSEKNTSKAVNGIFLDRFTPGNETDFYYSVDDINSAVDPDEVELRNYSFHKEPDSHTFKSYSESGNCSQFKVTSGLNGDVSDECSLSVSNFEAPPKDLVDDSENNLLSSSDFDDKYQADVSSCEDFARVVFNFELNVDNDKSTDGTCESSKSSSSLSTKSGSYRLTECESNSGERSCKKHVISQNVENENDDSNIEQFYSSNISDRVSCSEDFKFIPSFTVTKKISCAEYTGRYSNSSTSNEISLLTEDGKKLSNVDCSDKIFAHSEDAGLFDPTTSNDFSSFGDSNTLDQLSFRSEDIAGLSSTGSSNGVSFHSEHNVELSEIPIKPFFQPEDCYGFSNSGTSNGASFYSEDSTGFNSGLSNGTASRTETTTESSTENFSEDNTVLVESESELSISSDIIAWQRDIFLSVLDDSDEDWIIHDRAEWFSSNDYEGRVYFFEENSNESSWTLPEPPDTCNVNESPRNDKDGTPEASPIQEPSLRPSKLDGTPEEKSLSRSIKSRSMILLDSKLDELTPMSRNWPQLWNGHMCILQEGPMNRTKITENGKRLRKNWASAYVVLTELFLLFFKDAKSFAAMRNGGWKPELCVDLNGALIDRGDKVSSRKNVFIMSTVLGLQVLIQCDCSTQANNWLTAIQSAIKNLPSGFDNCSRLIRNSTSPECNSPEGGKKAKIGRSKSVKLKNKDGSIEDLTISVAERQTKIRARLKKFFHRRPTMESLVKKGIWKDEPVFGCFLEQVCAAESPRVPLVVQRCVKCIEGTEENMKADGLYRASGNLSQVQKLRLQVDQNNLSVLDQEEDVHVLTGALKLFFRELKEPLIPCHLFSKALKASTSHSRKEKLNCFREITKALPTANYDTLKYLLQHLLRVTKYKEFNRMHIPNLAIVFGPTLMWPAQESTNMALDLMQQNLVIESFLVEFDQIFR